MRTNMDIIDKYEDKCQVKKGLYCSNGASLEFNPEGEKHPIFHYSNEKDVIHDLGGNTYVIHGKMTPFLVEDCSDITIKNARFTYECPTIGEFTVISSKPGFAEINIADDNKYLIENDTLIYRNPPYWSFEYDGKDTLSMIYLPQNGNLVMSPYRGNKTRFPAIPKIKKIIEVRKGWLHVWFEDQKIVLEPLSVFQTRHVDRNEIAGYFSCSKNIRLENVEFNFAGGMGLVFQNCRDIELINVRFIPKNGRVISSQADFFHFSNCSGNISLCDCMGVGAHDDIINVHGTYLRIMKVKKDKLLLRFMHPETFGFLPFDKGDEMEIVDGDSLDIKFKCMVKDARQINLTDIEVILEENAPKTIKEGLDAAQNISRNPSLHMNKCYFERIATRGILFTSEKTALIENCTFKHLGGPLLYVSGDCNSWFESGHAGKISLLNNYFEHSDCGMNGEGSPLILFEPIINEKKGPIHEYLEIKGNTFRKPAAGKYKIELHSLKQYEIEDNDFDAEIEIFSD